MIEAETNECVPNQLGNKHWLVLKNGGGQKAVYIVLQSPCRKVLYDASIGWMHLDTRGGGGCIVSRPKYRDTKQDKCCRACRLDGLVTQGF